MHSESVTSFDRPFHCGLAVLLASPDSLLISNLQRIFSSMGLRADTAADERAALALMPTLEDSAVILLDVRLAGVADGWVLAAMHEAGVHKRCAIALIADQVSDEWIARLREGAIDDIVPGDANAAAWSTHLNTMRRGQELYRELEHLREAAAMEMRHDRVTGAFDRETMLKILFRETDRVQRLHGVLSIVLFDLDDFGHWNRELGRDACDRLLREVAERTGRILRSYDVLGRVGKDEFLLALPGCSAINAVMMAERLRVEVFGDVFPVQDESGEAIPVRLTACFAVACSRGRAPVVVVHEAEQALALAKLSGPDTMRCASGGTLSREPGLGVAKLFSEAEALAHAGIADFL